MKFWVGVTDNSWYNYLAASGCDEVNFWQPSARAPFVGLEPGTPFLFKLKRPHNHIAGGGFFVKFAVLPLSLAWEAFGNKNGAADRGALEKLVKPLRSGDRKDTTDIGCTVLANPFFFRRDDWIDAPDDWSSNIVVGKTYDTVIGAGKALWAQVQERLSAPAVENLAVQEKSPEYGSPYLSRARLGQGAFRVLVTEAYRRRCAVTGETILPVLEAAHIKPFSEKGPNNPFNGLLLRSDFHKLFDLGLVTIVNNNEDYRIEVSPRIREEWFNGKAYYRLHGQPLAVLPEDSNDRPRTDLLRWHNENRYSG